MALLALDVGNSHTVIGVFDGDDLFAHWKVESNERRTADEWHLIIAGLLRNAEVDDIDAVSACCTVPNIAVELRTLADRYFDGLPVSFVGPGIKTGVPILTDNPREVGADRIINALAAASEFGGPAITSVVDFGEDEKVGMFMVMEFVDGEPLHKILFREKRLSVKKACEIVLQVSEALHYIPALNADAAHVAALASLARRHAQGWLP